ncbi:MAG: two-component regulator propeller domain-containing protein, partial [Melioribacteraceae bacterium]|nr:two-component regulator propeller domain-containing protein [Melioribacteraceae bacterium]
MFLRKTFFIWIVASLIVSANNPNYRIERLSLEKGISHNTVFSITQDSEKYLWFATMFGLIRYDGQNYVKYRTDPTNYNTLSDDDIVTVYEASDGRMWIGTFGGGINVFDKDSLKFKRYNQDNPKLKDWSGIVWDIIEDSEKNIWLTTNNEGIIKISTLDGSIETIRNSDSSKQLSSNYLQTITKDSSGIWFGGYGGLTHLDKNTQKFSVYSDENINTVFIKDIEFINDNLLLCATNKGLYSFTLSDASFDKIVLNNSENNGQIDINRIIRTSKNQIWLGTQSGIYICDSNLSLINHISEEEYNLYNNSVVSLHEDHSGIIWVGSYLGGVSKILETDNRFTLINHNPGNSNTLTKGKSRDFAIDEDKNIWVCTSEGITKLNKDLTVSISYSTKKIQDKLNLDLRFTSLEIDSLNNLYLGTNQGVVKVDPKFRLLEKYTRDESGLSSNVVTKLLIDSRNNLWVGTVFGLSRINLDNGDISNWNPNSESNSITGQNVLSLFEDSEGIIWLGTYRGLNRIDPHKNEVEFIGPGFNDNSKISNKYIFDFLEIDSSNVWIATGNGINVLNRKTEKFSFLNRDHGLANAVIESFINFKNKVYISTNYGISIFDKNDGTIQNYDGEDGLGNNLFSAGASLLTPDNKILFGGLNGISVVDPQNFILNKNVPQNKLTSVKIFDEEIKPTEWNKKLELAYDKNSITFNFAGLEYTNPSKNHFAYRLEGL